MPGSDLDLLTDAATEAGRIARRYWRKSPETWEKPGEGPVTEADIAVNRMLHAELRAARPDYGWLSEESPDDPSRLEHDHVFIIDPIDGTRAFIAGEETFSHALAVVLQGQVTAGVVHLPVPGRTYAASAGRPATLNGAVIRARAGSGRVLASAAALDAAQWPGGVPPLRRAFRASLAHRLALVADGSFEAMLTFRPTWEWDAAAGALIAIEAGATVTDMQAGPLQFNRPDPRVNGLIAAAPALHAELVARRLSPSPVPSGPPRP